jgi:regulator of sigma E protease
MISANLAVINFLPLPVLDGGHMVFLIYEGVTGRTPDERVQAALTWAGLIFILGLMICVFGLDIGRLLHW